MAYAPPQQKNPAGVIIGVVVGIFVLIFIMGIFAAILFPVFARARDKAREVTSMQNLKQLGLGTIQYVQDNNQKYPPMDSYEAYKNAVYPYVKSDKVFIETGANVPYQQNPELGGKSLGSLEDPHNTEVLRETVPHADHRIAILYADGSVQLLPVGGS